MLLACATSNVDLSVVRPGVPSSVAALAITVKLKTIDSWAIDWAVNVWTYEAEAGRSAWWTDLVPLFAALVAAEDGDRGRVAD